MIPVLALLACRPDPAPSPRDSAAPPATAATADTGPPPDEPLYTGPTHPELVEWVPLPGGAFLMGSEPPEGEPSEWPAHEVTLAPFAIARTEITVGQYEACVAAGVCDPVLWSTHCHGEDPADDPLVQSCLDWTDAALFCAFAGGRLPREAEWEYAARSAGLDHEYPWGDAPPDCDHAVTDACAANGGSVAVQRPCRPPLGATAHGLCDMAGNAFEWVEDWFVDGYAGASPVGEPPPGPTGFRTMRGGGVGSGEPVRTRTRTFHPPEFTYGGMGARCARSG